MQTNKKGFFKAFGIRRCWESWDYPTQKEKVRGTLSTYINTDEGSREDKPTQIQNKQEAMSTSWVIEIPPAKGRLGKNTD